MFDVVQTALADYKQQTDDAIRRLMREVGMLQQSLAAQTLPLHAQTPGLSTPVACDPSRATAHVVLDTALAEWQRRVREPKTPGDINAQRIDEYIRGPQGLGWNTVDTHTWKAGVPYLKNKDYAWCGAFAAFCWGAAGLKPQIRRDHFAGTDRLWAWARNTKRLITRWQDLLPADVVVVGRGGTPPGGHITLLREPVKADQILLTFEGNAVGSALDGERVEGVVMNTRKVLPNASEQTFCFGVRPLPELGDY